MSSIEIGQGSRFTEAGGGEIAVAAEPGPDDSAPEIRVGADPDWGRVGLVRRLACVLDDGSVLALAAARPAGADGHGTEAISAVLLRPGTGDVPLAGARLTTEYDPAGDARRIGLELLPADEEAPHIRGAGTRQEPGVFDFTLDGTAGIARYEIGRPG